jgi:hypothetical protein
MLDLVGASCKGMIDKCILYKNLSKYIRKEKYQFINYFTSKKAKYY